MADKGKGLLLVMMDIDPRHEEEFNRWYNEEHVPERLSIPGFLSARRYRALEGTPKYLALYELENPEVLNTKTYRYLFGEGQTEWTKRMSPRFKNFIRNVYVQIFPPEREGIASQLNVEVMGRGSGPALVLLHPWGGNLRLWDECISHWLPRYRVVAYDRRGSGRSPNPMKFYNLDDHSRDLEELRQTLGLEQIIPVGIAVGALIAAVYAAKNPDRVPALVLCDPALTTGPSSRKLVEERVALVRKGGMEAILPDAVDKAFYGLPKDNRYWRYMELFRQNDPVGYEKSGLGFLDVDLAPILPQIHRPVLVAAGEFDILFPPEGAKRVSEILPQATFHVIPRAAHFPPFQAPETFAALVDKFLSGIP
jgi:pimeloyl-ACP methyl ester carboxylesterase